MSLFITAQICPRHCYSARKIIHYTAHKIAHHSAHKIAHYSAHKIAHYSAHKIAPYFSDELCAGSTWYCTLCDSEQSAITSTSISHLPPYLVLQLNRFNVLSSVSTVVTL